MHRSCFLRSMVPNKTQRHYRLPASAMYSTAPRSEIKFTLPRLTVQLVSRWPSPYSVIFPLAMPFSVALSVAVVH